MQSDRSASSRKHPAHHTPIVEVGRPTVIFLTVCVRKGGPTLTSSVWHDALRHAWTQADRWQVGLYCLMPDHVHLFCAPNTWPMLSLKRWVAFWKTRTLRHAGHCASIWQENFWDTQIRDYAHYVEKMAYVRRNPVRKELVATAEAWPFTGELNVFRW